MEKYEIQSRKRRQMWLRIIIIAVLMIGIMILIGSHLYKQIQSPYWDELSMAKAKAFKQFQLVEIQEASKFVSDQTYYIILGIDDQNQQVAAWIWQDGQHLIPLKQALTKAEIKEIALNEDQQKNILRIMPGKIKDEYVWEVFYQSPDPDGVQRHYYDFYRFTDGEKIDTYTLARPL
jgi:uncharacterized protein YpmB